MTQKQTNEKKAIKRYEMNKNYYITVDQIINKLDMKYKFFESKEIFDPEYLREYLGEKVSEHDKEIVEKSNVFADSIEILKDYLIKVKFYDFIFGCEISVVR